MTEPTAPLLAVKDLHVGFRTPRGIVQALGGVSFHLHAGEILGLVGESGCGKSTVASAVLGLLADNAVVSGGSIRLGGEELIGARPSRLRALRGRHIGMVFQDPLAALNPFHSIGAQVIEAIRAHLPLSHSAAREKALSLFAAMGLPEPAQALNKYPHQMSGGQRQRVGMALALAADPQVLIADEPTTALDVTIQAQVLDLLRGEIARRQLAVVLITHDLGVVAQTCQRVAVLYAGRVVEEASTRELFAAPQHPYTQGLLSCLPRLDVARDAPLDPIPGAPPRIVAGQSSGCAFAPRCALLAGHVGASPCASQVPELTAVAGAPSQRVACWLRQPG